MREVIAERLYRPESAGLRFLPEGPYATSGSQFSWVAIQHGKTAQTGSLNLFDLDTLRNRSIDLPGRPGFAFPTSGPGEFVIGLERHVVLLDTATGAVRPLCGPVDGDVEGTIINDGVVTPEGLIFGCKDLRFAESKAGLYLWHAADRRLTRLRRDQICSNGKKRAVWRGRDVLLDIDTPTRQVVAYPYDTSDRPWESRDVALDLTNEPAYPDGMVLAPDGRSAIVAFYDPRDVAYGVARQYDLESGRPICEWRTPGSPRVTCPLLIEHGGKVRLVLTTAVEDSEETILARHPDAGCLFVADTEFETASPCPVYGGGR